MSNQNVPAHASISLLVRPLVRLLARPLFFVLARHLAHLLDQLGIGFRVGLLHVCWLVVCFAAAHHVWVTNTKRTDYGRRIAQGGQRRHARSASRTQTRAREQTMPAARAARSADLMFLCSGLGTDTDLIRILIRSKARSELPTLEVGLNYRAAALKLAASCQIWKLV